MNSKKSYEIETWSSRLMEMCTVAVSDLIAGGKLGTRLAPQTVKRLVVFFFFRFVHIFTTTKLRDSS